MEWLLLENIANRRVIQMKNGMGYGTFSLKKYNQESPALKGSYEVAGFPQGYRRDGILFGSQPGRSNSLSKLEQYLQSKRLARPQYYVPNSILDDARSIIGGYRKAKPGPLANPYSIEQKLQAKHYDQPFLSNLSRTICLRCGEKLGMLGSCNRCGWGSPSGKW